MPRRQSKDQGDSRKMLMRTKSQVRRTVRARTEELKAAEKGTKALLQYALDHGEIITEEASRTSSEAAHEAALPAPRFSAASANSTLDRMTSKQDHISPEPSFHPEPCLTCLTESRHAAVAARNAKAYKRVPLGSLTASEVRRDCWAANPLLLGRCAEFLGRLGM